MELVDSAYKLARKLPVEEKYELSAQIRRSAVSIPSNIAEGHGRAYRREYLHFLSNERIFTGAGDAGVDR